jgi:glyoxylase-like metal-dependent hydrolase (beta-lactamase superfamily II)
MSAAPQATDLIFPRPVPPQPGEMVDIAPGIRWLRLALPFALDHVNIYLIDDGDGWAVVDTGVADARTRIVWADLLRDKLDGRPLTRLILTHFHPDHLGLAGWMTGELGLELHMTPGEYRAGRNAGRLLDDAGRVAHRAFFTRHGLDTPTIDAAMGRGTAYMRMTTGLPEAFKPLIAGETLRLGGRDFEIYTGGGHAPEQAMLLNRADHLFLAADQVLARISPNIGVWPTEPDSNPLKAYLTSLAALRQQIPDNVFALPAHNLPFYGLHHRIEALQRHHEARCNDIIAACTRPSTTAEVLPVLFPRLLDAHQIGFAFGEVLAHINYLVGTGALASATDADGVIRVERV